MKNVISNDVSRFPRSASGWEILHQPLFDREYARNAKTIPAIGKNLAMKECAFFMRSIGTGDKSSFDTNMELSGQLPTNKQFLVEGVGIRITKATVEEKEDFRTFGLIELFIGSAIYFKSFTGECMAFEPTDDEYDPRVEAPFFQPIKNHINIMSNQNFMVRVKWPAACQLSDDVSIQVILDGKLARRSQ